jgi:hypothetical protein
MEACICVFSFSFFCLWQEGSNLGDPAWGVAVIVSFNGGYLTLFFFSNFIFNFGARSTQHRCIFQDTRPSVTFPFVVRSSRRKLRLGHVSRRCLARASHVPKSLLLFGALDGHVLLSLAVHGVGWGLRWSIYGWVVLVTARVLHASPPSAESAAVSRSVAFFWVFSVLCCVFLLFPSVQSVCVLLKFY